MSQDSGQKNIRSIRTFSEDVSRVKQLKTPNEKGGDAELSPIKKEPEQKTVPLAPEAKTQATAVQKQKEIVQQRVKVPAAAPKIRAFVPKQRVDLSDEVASLAKPVKTSILSDTDEVFQSSNRAGNIIRDTKRKRFRLFPAMLQAATSWFEAKKEAYEAFRHPNHLVTKAETRKKILQASVREDAQAPKEDFKDVVTRMKTTQRAEVTSTLSFKEKSEVPAPTWTHVEEENAPLVAEHASFAQSTESFAPEMNRETAEQTPSVPLRSEETQEIHQTQSIEPLNPVIPSLPQDEAPAQAPLQEVPEPIEDEVMQDAPVQTPEVPSGQPAQTYPAIAYGEQQRMPIYYFIVVILVASLSGIGMSYYFFVVRNAPPQQIVVEYKVPQLLFTSAQTPFRFGEDRKESLEIIKDFVDRSQTVTQLYPTVVEEGIEKPAPTQTIINALQLQAPGSFTRAVNEITFGGTPQRQPFIVLKVTSFDTAFAGILQWEKTMSADLSPLFGETVINSFDPSARTDTQVREAFFKDVIASNKNARLLLDEEGEDRIVYTFINQNTILITTTRETLDELLPLVR
jgi:hypothetical protein